MRTTNGEQMLRKTSTMKWYLVLLVITIVLVIAIPPSPGTINKYHISLTEYRILISTLILPFAIIWFSAFYAYNRMRLYSNEIQHTREGKAFKNISDGIGVLAWGLAITTILSILFGAIANAHSGFTATQKVIIGYFDILVPLIGFTFIGNGTRKLNVIAKLRPSLVGTRMIVFVFLVIGVFYTHLVVTNSAHSQNPYYLSLYWLLLTFIIPFLYAWFIGLLCANEIRLYAQSIKGIIYKRVLIQLAAGIAIVILSSIASQFISSVYLTKHSIAVGSALLFIYPVLVIEAIGYGLIAYGARWLKRIEEV
jgi:hypothetical protein